MSTKVKADGTYEFNGVPQSHAVRIYASKDSLAPDVTSPAAGTVPARGYSPLRGLHRN